MVFDGLAGVVLVVHLAFILFVAAGALLAWRWPWLLWLHVPAVAWGVGSIVIGYECPLTPLEKWFRTRGGGEGYEGGFIDRYIENVIYPEEYTPALRALAAVMIVAGYVGLFRRQGSRRRVSMTARQRWARARLDRDITDHRHRVRDVVFYLGRHRRRFRQLGGPPRGEHSWTPLITHGSAGGSPSRSANSEPR